MQSAVSSKKKQSAKQTDRKLAQKCKEVSCKLDPNETSECKNESELENKEEEFFIPKKNSKWERFKVTLCNDYLQNSKCSQGDLCLCAHSIYEIRFKDSPIPLRVKDAHENSKLTKTAKPLKIVQTHSDPLNNSNNFLQLSIANSQNESEIKSLHEELKQKESEIEMLNKTNKELRTKVEFYENNLRFKNAKMLVNQIKELEYRTQILTDEVDQKLQIIISLNQKNNELTEKVSEVEKLNTVSPSVKTY